jgi:hypothetical protein
MRANDRRYRWISTLVAVLVGGALLASPADAGKRARCRAACKELLSGCAAVGGKAKRACKRGIMRGCRVEGPEFCDFGSITTTTSPDDGTTTTTTTLPPAPGKVVLHVDDIARDASTNPGRYDLLVTLTGDEESQAVSLGGSPFYVLDKQEARYEALAPVAEDDCSSDDVVTPGGSVTCWVHFTLPVVAGWDEEEGGEGYAVLYFETGGYRRRVYFQVHPSGWGTIS